MSVKLTFEGPQNQAHPLQLWIDETQTDQAHTRGISFTICEFLIKPEGVMGGPSRNAMLYWAKSGRRCPAYTVVLSHAFSGFQGMICGIAMEITSLYRVYIESRWIT
jgi:hypothetical protein